MQAGFYCKSLSFHRHLLLGGGSQINQELDANYPDEHPSCLGWHETRGNKIYFKASSYSQSHNNKLPHATEIENLSKEFMGWLSAVHKAV